MLTGTYTGNINMATGSKLEFPMISFPQAYQCVYVSSSTSLEESVKLIPMKDIYLTYFLHCVRFIMCISDKYLNNFSVVGWE